VNRSGPALLLGALRAAGGFDGGAICGSSCGVRFTGVLVGRFGLGVVVRPGSICAVVAIGTGDDVDVAAARSSSEHPWASAAAARAAAVTATRVRCDDVPRTRAS
jgi:hypothetical protein